MTQRQQFAQTLTHVCDLLEARIPRQVSPDRFVQPVLTGLRDEWYATTRRIVRRIMGYFSASILLEVAGDLGTEESEERLTEEERRKVLAILALLLGNYRSKGHALIDAQQRRALLTFRNSAAGRGMVFSDARLQAALTALDQQRSMLDHLQSDTETRVAILLQRPYANAEDLGGHLVRFFRIDREEQIGRFQSATHALADQVIDGTLTPAAFRVAMREEISSQYTRLYRLGKGSPLTEHDMNVIRLQIDTQDPYLTRFQRHLEIQQATGDPLTGRVRVRAGLYAQRGSALYERGYLASLPESVLLDWVLQPAEHCPDCPARAAGSPYMVHTLPGYPGDGSTKCGTNCRCVLQPNPAYQLAYQSSDLPV